MARREEWSHKKEKLETSPSSRYEGRREGKGHIGRREKNE